MSTYLRFRIFCIIFCISQDVSTATWARIQRKCIQVIKNQIPYSSVKKACELQNGFTFSSKNQKEFDFLTTIQGDANLWVGLSRNSSNGKWYWDDGREFLNPQWWFSGHPGTYMTAYFRDGTLRGTDSTTDRWYFCEKEANYVVSPIDSSKGMYGFCGVEIMPNCDGLPCEDICFSHPDCNQYAIMSNLCVNIKNATQTDKCIVNLSSQVKLFSLNLLC